MRLFTPSRSNLWKACLGWDHFSTWISYDFRLYLGCYPHNRQFQCLCYRSCSRIRQLLCRGRKISAQGGLSHEILIKSSLILFTFPYQKIFKKIKQIYESKSQSFLSKEVFTSWLIKYIFTSHKFLPFKVQNLNLIIFSFIQ